MKESLSSDELLQAIDHIMQRLEAAAGELDRLDAAIGDGDLGTTVALGSRAVRGILPELAGQDVGTVIARCGATFDMASPSAVGSLLAAGAARAGAQSREAELLDAPLLARAVVAAEAGIKAVGKASRGDKTLLDALGPSAEVLATAAAEGDTLPQAVASAAAAAWGGVQKTTLMKARFGAAAGRPERGVGHPDPGATLILMIWEAFSDFLRESSLGA